MAENTNKAKVVNFKAKDLIIKEGDRDRFLYVIRQGSVRVYKTYLGRKLTLAILGKGEVFGELTFFDGQPRIANVEAIDDVQGLAVDGELAQSDLEMLPSWMPGIFKTIIARLRETDNKLTLLKNKYDLGSGAKDDDLIIKEVILETLRLAKILKLYFSVNGNISSADFEKKVEEFDVLFGNTFLEVEKIIFFFQKGGYLVEGSGTIELDEELINNLISYLETKVESKEIWLLSRTSLRYISEILKHVDDKNLDYDGKSLISDVIENDVLDKFTNYEDFFREAKSMGLIEGKKVKIKISEIQNHVDYQTFMANYNVRVD